MTTTKFKQNPNTSKLNKIKALATDPAATNGERQAAVEALRRLGEPMAITTTSDQVTLIPLSMVTPNHKGIYAPSRFEPVIVCPQLPERSKKIMVSLAEDGVSNSRPMVCYTNSNGDFWMVSR